MKIKTEDYEKLYKHVKDWVDSMAAQKRSPQVLELAYKSQSFTPKRLRWDILNSCGVRITSAGTHRDDVEKDLQLYDYLDDTHIDTALRKILNDLGFVWASKE